ncbi:MAG TPA: hypothetical protein VFL94_06180 [Actinomycetales bacterium]|nr:hypothetical protein [Actinomycetales bacterium]
MSADLPGVSVLTPAGGPPPGRRGSLSRAVLEILGVVVVGVLCGVLWWWLAPMARADVEQGAVYLRGHTELQAAQDCWFAVVLGALGVVTATVHGWRAGSAGSVQSSAARAGAVAEPLLLVVALVVVGLVAWRTGVLLGPDSLADQVAHGAQHPLTPLALHSWAVLLVAPFLFSFTALLAALFAGGARRTS